ncbi:uncharacterized protein FMAN_13233 [Fusarium mangiferae]|uniref:CFEM domain-containing protein n=1 Tax=Fusarium mangiferae TaxID=192010 RepID=A0A1L7T8A7_FUSMA|nr:uncharacterized protein FMAN_13233 [Fusarium mangiferae]CVK94968.1 uncharacterized protein FMAN_13233 [Fusarium mangiferae]
MIVSRGLFLLCLAVLATAISLSEVPSCAIPCILETMDSSGETNANIRSMCEDPDFQTDVLNCVTGVCTAQEIQGFIVMGKELCQMPLQDNRQEYRATIIVFATLSFFFFVLRVTSKILTKNAWGTDDTWAAITFCILIPFTVFTLLAIHHGLGLATPLFTRNDLSQALKEIFILHLLYVCGLAAAKTSILFFYLRIFSDNSFRMLVWATHAFNALSTVIIITLNLTLGRSVTYLLENSSDDVVSMRKYSNAIKIVLAHCVVNLALDVWMLILPMTQLYNIGLKLDKKISVMAMFGLGLFLTVVSLIRTIYQSQLLAKPEEAQTGQVQVVLWACIETYMGAIVASVPSTRQLVRKVIYRMRKQNEGQSTNKPIFIDRSLAPIPDDEDMPTLSDVGGLTTVTVSSGRTAVSGTEHEMETVSKLGQERNLGTSMLNAKKA